MAETTAHNHKPADLASLHSTSQDSAVRLSEDSDNAPQHHENYAAGDDWPLLNDASQANVQDNHNFLHDPYDNASDSGFDSGSLLGDETDTLASSIMNYRIENGRQYHAYRDGAYWGASCVAWSSIFTSDMRR